MTEHPGESPGDEVRYSVVIPAYGPTPYLEDLIRDLLAQRPAPGTIVVVHTGSDDPTQRLAPLIASSSIPVRVVHEEGRLYAGAARNRGVEEVNAPWVVFLDCDVVPAVDFGSAVARTIYRTTDSCFVGAVHPAGGGYWGLCMWFIEFGSVHPYLPSRRMDTGPSINMLVKREVFLAAGGFPPELSAGEDAVCQLRMNALGGRLRFAPGIRVGHHMAGGFASYRRHLLPLGAAAAGIRRIFRLPGSRAATNPLLAPGLWLARLGQISLRVFRYGGGHRLQFLFLLPGILTGLLVWNWGFVRFLLTDDTPDLEPHVDPAALTAYRAAHAESDRSAADSAPETEPSQ